jgi:hypothetical protein
MNIETVDELVDQLADWMGIYGGCKNPHDDTSCETKCEFDPKRPFCCRNGFASAMEDRIRNAVSNEEKLSKL